MVGGYLEEHGVVDQFEETKRNGVAHNVRKHEGFDLKRRETERRQLVSA